MCTAIYSATSFNAADAIRTGANVHIAHYRQDGKPGKLHYFRAEGKSYAFETDNLIFRYTDTEDNGFKVYRGRSPTTGELFDVYKCGSDKKYDATKPYLSAYLNLPQVAQGALAPHVVFHYKSRGQSKTAIFLPPCLATLATRSYGSKKLVEDLKYTLYTLCKRVQELHRTGYANAVSHPKGIGVCGGQLQLRDLSAVIDTRADRQSVRDFAERRWRYRRWSAPRAVRGRCIGACGGEARQLGHRHSLS